MNTTNKLENNNPKLHGTELGKELYKKYLEENSHTPKSLFVTSNQEEYHNKDQAIQEILNHLPANLPIPTDTDKIDPTQKYKSKYPDTLYEIDAQDKKKLFTASVIVGTIKALRLYYDIFKSMCESLPDFGEIISDSIKNGLSQKTFENTKDTFNTIGWKIQRSLINNYKEQIKYVVKSGLHLLKIEKAFDKLYEKQLDHIPLDNIFQKFEEDDQKYYQ